MLYPTLKPSKAVPIAVQDAGELIVVNKQLFGSTVSEFLLSPFALNCLRATGRTLPSLTTDLCFPASNSLVNKSREAPPVLRTVIVPAHPNRAATSSN
jgi:hypothetical protein